MYIVFTYGVSCYTYVCMYVCCVTVDIVLNYLAKFVYIHAHIFCHSVVPLQLYTKDHQVMLNIDGDDNNDVVSKLEHVDVSFKTRSVDLSQYPQWHYYEVLSHAIVNPIIHDGIL